MAANGLLPGAEAWEIGRVRRFPMKTMTTPKAWYQCLDAGTAAVRRPYELRQFPQQGTPRITLYYIPSFQDATGWTVYYRPRTGEYLLQAVTWHQAADGRRIEELMVGKVASASAEPTLTEATAALDPAWFERQFAALSSIRIPLHTSRPIGLDGENFGIHVWNEFEVEWWCEGPSEWSELIRWAQECIEHFRQSTAERPAE